MPKVYVTAVGRVSAPLDGSGLLPDPRLGGRLSARSPVQAAPGELRLHALARVAAEQALADLPGLAKVDARQKAVFISASKGGLEAFDTDPPDLGPGLWRWLSSSPGQAVRDRLGWQGGGRNTPLACATGAYSLGLAFESLREGRLQAALAGATEASLTPLAAAAFANLGALSPAAQAADYRGPFDQGRQGFVLGEGAAALVLESEAGRAVSGSRPLAVLSGWACTCDAYHLTAPEPHGREAARCVRLALQQAGLTPDDIAYVNAHGTGTAAGDDAEALALHSVFGPRPSLRVSSIKGATGHTLGAAGALEAAVSVEVLSNGRLPPNIGCHQPLPSMKDWLVRNAEHLRGDHVVSLSMGFGGHNVALVFSRP